MTPLVPLAPLHYRQAQKQDMPWAYSLFRENLRRYIEQTWGWDEVFQRHSFDMNLPAQAWQIASQQGQDVAAYCLKDQGEYLQLAMLLVLADRQRQGIGSQIITDIKQQATTRGMPLRLDVLKRNPAHEFYRATGFAVEDQDGDRFRFYWSPTTSEN